ncbi:MAG: translation initiation factor IF-3 [Bacilli bacterium]|nr:translation initiation factor IF-3 [Mollicutes bacterium]MDY3899630.1 translation initiation factor IF-3 [Bacilli bacterium]
MSKVFDQKNENLINEDIQAEVVLVISETGEQLGKLNLQDALKLSEERGFDLVCVAPNAPVPVCRLMDYSKYRYEQIKKAKEAKKNQRIIQVKEVRISPTIDTHDFETKQKAAKKFLMDGDKVKVSCRFRGRMIDQANNTKELFVKFAADFEEFAQIDQQPYLDGRNMFMMLSPKLQKKKN